MSHTMLLEILILFLINLIWVRQKQSYGRRNEHFLPWREIYFTCLFLSWAKQKINKKRERGKVKCAPNTLHSVPSSMSTASA